MENNTPLIQYTTVSDSVYLWIKNAIIQGDFKPGEHIAQETLTKKLGVSRTPVRDAIKRLETRHFTFKFGNEAPSDNQAALRSRGLPAFP